MPKVHLISCSKCGRIHPWGKCSAPKNPRPRHYNPEKRTNIQRFRSSALWQHKAEQIKKRDKYLCRLCLYNNLINSRDLSVHHIIPIAEAEHKCLDSDNLITLCKDCHNKVEGDNSYKDLLATLAASPPGLKAEK